MGLDMFLEAELFIGGQYEHRNPSGEFKGSVDGREYVIPTSSISKIVLQVGYWRKANAIHNWFVKCVQDGTDECQRSYVSREELKDLLELVITILDSPPDDDNAIAKDLLPTRSGFFFGGTDYDKWYYLDLRETVLIINKALDLPEEYSLYYEASW